jgi:hypothetical protein
MRHLVALRLHALGVGDVITALQGILRACTRVRTDSCSNDGSRRRADCRAAAAADCGAKTSAERRTQDAFAERGVVCSFRTARNALARIAFAGGFVPLKHIK